MGQQSISRVVTLWVLEARKNDLSLNKDAL